MGLRLHVIPLAPLPVQYSYRSRTRRTILAAASDNCPAIGELAVGFRRAVLTARAETPPPCRPSPSGSLIHVSDHLKRAGVERGLTTGAVARADERAS